jgi:site-specific recombinase
MPVTESHPLALHPLAIEAIAEPETDALTLAWRTEQEIIRLKRRVAKLEEERLRLIDEAREADLKEVDLGHGIVRLVVSPGTRTRVLDVDRFKAEFPKAFRKVATYSVKLPDAERESGKAAVHSLCDIREGAERVKLDFEATFDPLAPKEATGA